MTICLDNSFISHTENDGTMTEVIAPQNFDGLCPKAVECMRYVPEGMQYTEMSGVKINGPFIQCVDERASAYQAQYEADMSEAANAYQEGVDSV